MTPKNKNENTPQDIKFALFGIFKCTFSGVNYIYIVMQQISRTFSFPKLKLPLSCYFDYPRSLIEDESWYLFFYDWLGLYASS